MDSSVLIRWLERLADLQGRANIPKLHEAYRAAAAAVRERDELRNALMVSEQYRRKYEEGKHALYAMGGEVLEAAMKTLPCGEGAINSYTAKVEREHSPLLVERLAEVAKERSALAARVGDMQATLNEAAWFLFQAGANEMAQKCQQVAARAAELRKEGE